MVYNVFIDHPVSGFNAALISTDRAYDASAVANFACDEGWSVSTDLWSATVPDAMVSPQVFSEFALAQYVRS